MHSYNIYKDSEITNFLFEYIFFSFFLFGESQLYIILENCVYIYITGHEVFLECREAVHSRILHNQ